MQGFCNLVSILDRSTFTLTEVTFLLGSSIFLVSIVPPRKPCWLIIQGQVLPTSVWFSPYICRGSISGYVCHQTAWQSSKQPWMSPWSLIAAFIQTLRTSERRSSCRSALDVSLLWLKISAASTKPMSPYENWPSPKSLASFRIHGRLHIYTTGYITGI